MPEGFAVADQVRELTQIPKGGGVVEVPEPLAVLGEITAGVGVEGLASGVLVPHTATLPFGDGGRAVQAGSVGGVDQGVGQPGGAFRPGDGVDRIGRQRAQPEPGVVEEVEGFAGGRISWRHGGRG